MPKLTPEQAKTLAKLYLRRYYNHTDNWYLPDDEPRTVYSQLVKKGLMSAATAADKLPPETLTKRQRSALCYQLNDEGRAAAWDWIKNRE